MMKRCLLRGAFACVLLVVQAWTSDARGQNPESFVPGQIIIKFDPSAPQTDALAVRTNLNATVKQRFESIGAELWEISGIAVPDAVDRFKNDRRIAYIEPNYVVHADALFPNDPRFSELWGLHNTGQTGGTPDADIDAPEAWSLGTGGTVLVGVIDTGVDWHHVDLAGNIFTNPGEIAGNGVDDDGNGFIDDIHGWDFVNNDNDPSDDNGHGTHVSGTIAAIGNNGIGVVGVSWSARILPLKFLDAGGSGTTANAIRAVEYATGMGVRLTSNSWGGGGFSAALQSAIEAAGNQGILFVAAAGNDGVNNDTFPHYPSSYNLDNIISVASTDHNDARSGFSNYGLVSVDLGAPGSDILSTFPGNSYGTISGTSMATPHVSGAVCLIWAVAPLMTHLEVKNAILSSVDPIPALAGRVVSGGRLNVHNMLSGLDDIPPARVANLAVASTGSTSARLTWTAAGDDGPLGTASRYDLRYSTSGIYWSNFDAATPVAGTPHPQPVGSPESFEVTGLDFNTRYYFALVVEDEQGNRSQLSNLPNGTTLGAPQLYYFPGSFSANLYTGGTETQLLTIGNAAQGTLDFSTTSSPEWARLDPPSGRVYAGQTLQVEVIFDATRLSGGIHDGTVALTTNDQAFPVVSIPLSLHVTDAADIVAAPGALDFGGHYTGTCAPETLVVSNIGTAPLVVSGVSIDDAEFSTDPGAFTLPVGGSRALGVRFCPVSVGVIEGTLSIQSNDPDHPTYAVSLRGEGIAPPVIQVAPASLSADLFTGGISDQTLSISNQGGSDLDVEISLEETGGAAANVEVFGDPSLAGDVVGVGHPLSPGELKNLQASFPRDVFVGKSGETDKGKPSSKPTDASMMLSRIRGTNLEEVFGSAQNEFFAGPRTRGNLFTCTTSTTLVEHRFYMDPVGPTQMWFLVYEGLTQVGSYALISASDVTPAGPGLGWYSSGEIDVPMEAGRFYLIVASFEQLSSYFNELGISPYPIPASFGELTGGAGWTWAPTSQFPPAPFQDVPADAFVDAVAYYQTLVTGGAVRWLSVAPEAGTVPQGASMDLAVRFDAAGLFGGDYDANVRIASNDPVTPEVVVPAHLHVTGAPDIALSETLLDYGPRFIGAAVKDTLVVSNPGTDALIVTGIASDRPDYTVNLSSFTLPPTTSYGVVVTFSPLATGPIPGTLTIMSNDPDEPVLLVELRGEGVEPPVISVSPASFSEDLLTGGTATHTLSISNSGESSLSFDIAIEDLGGPTSLAADPASAAETPGGTSRDITPATGGRPRPPGAVAYSGDRVGSRTGEIKATRPAGASAFGLKILLLHAASVSEIRGLLLAFPDVSVVDEFDGSIATPTLGTLANYDAVILVENFTFADLVAMGDVLADYVDGGGGVIMTVPTFISGWDIRGRFATGGYYPFTLGFGPAGSGTMSAFDPTHPIMQGVTSAYGDLLGGTSVAPGAEWVAGWNIGFPFVATQGDHVVGVNVFVSDGGYWSGDVPLILHNAVVWSAGIAWLGAEPAKGVVPPHGSVDVAVTFDAAGLFGGNYAANLRVTSNDPITPEVVVPASLHVTGAPDIAVSETLLDYGPQFIGAAVKDTLVVSNEGTDLLTVSGISSSHPDYTVDISSFTLAPTLSRKVVVTFAPTSTGSIAATLTITSDDFDEGAVAVELRGIGVEPPVISVTPASFSENLFSGDTSTHTMTISNSGVSPLTFEIKREKLDASGVTEGGTGARDRLRERRQREAYAAAGTVVGSGVVTSQASHPRVAVAPAVGADAETAILVIQDYLAWGVDMRTFILDNFGILATLINSSQIASTDFSPFDLVITTGDQSYYYYNAVSSNVAKFESFVAAGGVVQYQLATQGDNVSIVGGVDVLWGFQEIFNDVVTPNHPIVAGLPLVLEGNWANHTYLANLPAGAVVITETSNSARPTTAEYKFGTGRVVVTGMTWEFLYNYGYVAGAMLGNAVEYSLSLAGVSWLSAEPASGTVEPGESTDITVGFDAGGLLGGDYHANLRIANNDPIHPEVVVPVDLHVTGAPNIVLSTTTLSYGPVFIGQGVGRTLHVANTGTDVLNVTGVASSHPDYTTDVTGLTLAPAATGDIVVTFAPTTAGPINATLTITSNDPDQGSLAVTLQGTGVVPPVIAVSPASLTEDLLTGETSSQPLTIDNSAGGSSLIWFASAQVAGDGGSVLEASPVLASGGEGGFEKDAHHAPAIRPDPGRIFSFMSRGDGIAASAVGGPTTSGIGGGLGAVLSILDANYARVTSAIPNRFDFFEGETGNVVLDGGNDMYDGGNQLGTNLGGIAYTNGVVAEGPAFGTGGRYFTKKYPGLFVLAADVDAVSWFEITGNLGADGGGSVDGAVLQARVAGINFYGFVKRVYAAGDPSVNHLIIVEENPAATHEFSTFRDDDYHRAVGLSASRRIYYLLYAGADGGYIDNPATLNIMESFLNAIGLVPGWIGVFPGSGTVPAGGSMVVNASFSAAGLFGGDYDANLVFSSNDPVNPAVLVPAHLHVTGVPDISVTPPVFVYFGQAFIGQTKQQTLVVSNEGTDLLTVSGVSSNHPDYAVDVTNFTLAPAATQNVVVSFTPATAGTIVGSVTITSDDPDEGTLSVYMVGEGAAPPVISVTPESLADTLVAGGSSAHNVTISNGGAGDLEFSVRAIETEVAAASAASRAGAPGGAAASADGGGPDPLGYRWRDSNDPGGPTFDWIDAVGGANVPLGDNDFEGGIAIGFTFNYYGQDFTTIGVGSNGWLSFNGSNNGFPISVPGVDGFAGAIAPYARDLYPPTARYIRCQTFGSAPNRQFVVEYNNIGDAVGGNPKTFEVILTEGANSIRFQYLTASNLPVGFGIESPDQLLGMGNAGVGDLYISPTRVTSSYAIEFSPVPVWLGVAPVAGTIPAGGSLDLVVTMDATELTDGDYAGRIYISSNDPATPVVPVQVSLTVGSVAITGVDPTAIPTRYELYTNRPNPFNPVTTIAYDLPRDARVRLVVYDVHGKEVRELASGAAHAGRHEIVWDGRNASGEPVASGVYFYRLVAADFVQTKKMVLLK